VNCRALGSQRVVMIVESTFTESSLTSRRGGAATRAFDSITVVKPFVTTVTIKRPT
jgi:hypothetical protein